MVVDISVRLPDNVANQIERCVECGLYLSRSDAIRSYICRGTEQDDVYLRRNEVGRFERR